MSPNPPPFCREGAPAFRRGEESPSGWEESPGFSRGEDVKEIPKDSVNRRIVFRFDCVDLEADCPWSLAHMSDEEHRLLLLKMRDFEKATVGEIISPSYQAFTCYPDFTQCPNQTPQDRLAKYYEREGDALARFRLGGTERLYGFLVGNEFHILWWDPNHEVWPSTRKHT